MNRRSFLALLPALTTVKSLPGAVTSSCAHGAHRTQPVQGFLSATEYIPDSPFIDTTDVCVDCGALCAYTSHWMYSKGCQWRMHLNPNCGYQIDYEPPTVRYHGGTYAACTEVLENKRECIDSAMRLMTGEDTRQL